MTRLKIFQVNMGRRLVVADELMTLAREVDNMGLWRSHGVVIMCSRDLMGSQGSTLSVML